MCLFWMGMVPVVWILLANRILAHSLFWEHFLHTGGSTTSPLGAPPPGAIVASQGDTGLLTAVCYLSLHCWLHHLYIWWQILGRGTGQAVCGLYISKTNNLDTLKTFLLKISEAPLGYFLLLEKWWEGTDPLNRREIPLEEDKVEISDPIMQLESWSETAWS